MDKSEGTIQKEIIDLLKLRGSLVFRMNAGSAKYNVKLAPRGTPDLLAVLPGTAIWLEVKTPKGKVSEDQFNMINDLRDRGELVYVVRSVEDVIRILGE